MDPNTEHGSIRYFTDSIICMDWGYNSCSNYLAIGLKNGLVPVVSLCVGDFFVNPCEKNIFKESIFTQTHISRFQKCICMKWRKTHNHVRLSFSILVKIALGYLKDGKYCIDVLNVENQSVVIPYALSFSIT